VTKLAFWQGAFQDFNTFPELKSIKFQILNANALFRQIENHNFKSEFERY